MAGVFPRLEWKQQPKGMNAVQAQHVKHRPSPSQVTTTLDGSGAGTKPCALPQLPCNVIITGAKGCSMAKYLCRDAHANMQACQLAPVCPADGLAQQGGMQRIQ